MKLRLSAPILALSAFMVSAHALPPQDSQTAEKTSSYIDAQGTAFITRVVPVPDTISPEAQQLLIEQGAPPKPQLAAGAKASAKSTRKLTGTEAYLAAYPANISSSTIAGVPVRVVSPLVTPANKADRVLINLHGGGFTGDSGSLTESIPIANLTQTKVIAVLYRLAPEHPFPAAVEDAVAVYKELLKTYKPQNIAIYGSSAGAVLTPEVAVQIKLLGLPLPGALGVFSGGGDFTRTGDSMYVYGVQGLKGPPDTRPKGVLWLGVYVGSADPKNPVLSPLFADLHGMPATLFMTSTRDMLLSNTTILHRAFLRAGVDAQLVVFEGLNHCFWYSLDVPESREANNLIARFFNTHLGRE